MHKMAVPYEIHPGDTRTVHLALGNRAGPLTDWFPAYRDFIDGKHVVWVKFAEIPVSPVVIWLRDGNSDRPMRETTV